MKLNRGQRVILWIVAILLTGASIGAAPSLGSSGNGEAGSGDFLLLVLMPGLLLGAAVFIDGGLTQPSERHDGQRIILWIIVFGLSLLSVGTGIPAINRYSNYTNVGVANRVWGVLLTLAGPILLIGGRAFLSATYPRPRSQKQDDRR